jgi:hypothetical protein
MSSTPNSPAGSPKPLLEGPQTTTPRRAVPGRLYVGSCETAAVRAGFPLPLGAYEFEGGVNFSLFSRDATRG